MPVPADVYHLVVTHNAYKQVNSTSHEIGVGSEFIFGAEMTLKEAIYIGEEEQPFFETNPVLQGGYETVEKEKSAPKPRSKPAKKNIYDLGRDW